MNYKSRDRTFRSLLRKFTDDDTFFFLCCTWKKRMLQPVTRRCIYIYFCFGMKLILGRSEYKKEANGILVTSLSCWIIYLKRPSSGICNNPMILQIIWPSLSQILCYFKESSFLRAETDEKKRKTGLLIQILQYYMSERVRH